MVITLWQHIAEMSTAAKLSPFAECSSSSRHKHWQVRPWSVESTSRPVALAQRPRANRVKLAVMIRRCLEDKAPTYLSDYCISNWFTALITICGKEKNKRGKSRKNRGKSGGAKPVNHTTKFIWIFCCIYALGL